MNKKKPFGHDESACNAAWERMHKAQKEQFKQYGPPVAAYVTVTPSSSVPVLVCVEVTPSKPAPPIVGCVTVQPHNPAPMTVHVVIEPSKSAAKKKENRRDRSEAPIDDASDSLAE